MLLRRNLLIGGAVLCFVGGLIYFFVLSTEEKLNRRLLHFAGIVIVCIALMEINSVFYTGQARFPQGILPKTMQAFSLDADYDTVFNTVVFPDHPFLETCFKWFKALVYSLAPLLGGAVICDILLGLSPEMQLFLKCRRHIFVFSEFNEKSISLAESIVNTNGAGKNYVIVFANCILGTDGEIESLISKAKELKAICMSNDLPYIKRLSYAKQCIIFLMSTSPDGSFSDTRNLILAQNLLNSDRCIWPQSLGCHLFYFTNEGSKLDDINSLKTLFEQNHHGDRGEVNLHVIRDYVQARAPARTERTRPTCWMRCLI